MQNLLHFLWKLLSKTLQEKQGTVSMHPKHLLHRALQTRLARLFAVVMLVLGLSLASWFAVSVVSSINTLPPEKQAIEDRYTQELEAGRQNPAPKDPQAPAPPDPIPDFRYPTGIIEGGDVPFSPQHLTIMNSWQKMVGDDLLVVYAGAPATDPEQGLLLVRVLSDDPSRAGTKRFLTPVKGGAATITVANNFQLGLVLTSRESFIFDVPSGTFVPALTVNIDIKPDENNPLELDDDEEIEVAILSAQDFGAPSIVDKKSLTFGRTGNEDSLKRDDDDDGDEEGSDGAPDCECEKEDVNEDGLPDLVCEFDVQKAGFQLGDTKGILKGKTKDGMLIVGRDSVVIVPRPFR